MEPTKYLFAFFTTVIALVATSCGSDEAPEPQNRPPGNFTVTVATSDNEAELSWTVASDPDQDPVTYSVKVDGSTIEDNLTATEYAITNLDPGSYAGQVVASDGKATSQASYNFTISGTPNQDPSVVVLTSPMNDDSAVVSTPTLTWQAATDPDGDAVSYEVYLDNVADPATLLATVTETSLTLNQRLFLGESFNWKVVANDGRGGSSTSEVFQFSRKKIAITPINAAAPHTPKYEHTSFLWDEQLWVIGGREPEFTSDVWNSSDGSNWTAATATPGFSDRAEHASVVFDNKMWVIGGAKSEFENDVWYSEDGSTWVEATSSADFPGRSEHSVVVFDNKMWVIGGRNRSSQKRNDVWYSSDGANWTEATAAAGFSARFNHASVVFDSKMWVIGGQQAVSGTERSNDVWYSEDGVNWTEATGDAAFSARFGHQVVTFDNRMWVIGGLTGVHIQNVTNEVWSSADGVLWMQMTGVDLPKRFEHSAIVFDNKIWITGGTDNIGTIQNEVWYFD